MINFPGVFSRRGLRPLPRPRAVAHRAQHLRARPRRDVPSEEGSGVSCGIGGAEREDLCR